MTLPSPTDLAPAKERARRIARKAARLAEPDARPRVVDLFCGAGGFSLGVRRAGFDILGGVELDEDAAASHARNFHGGLAGTAPGLFDVHATGRNIRQTDPEAWLRSLGHAEPMEAVDVIIGGPPCPAYTRVGRAKLREVADHPEAFKRDPRATLWVPYIRWVERLQPVALLMENVPDILNFGKHNLAEEICEVLEDLGYRCVYSILNAAAYGVPQTRQRFILGAVHEAAGGHFRFPEPTHRVDLPPGYGQAEKAALKPLREAGNLTDSRFRPAMDAPADAPEAVTAEQALSGLPPLTAHLSRKLKKTSQRPDESSAMPYAAAGAPRATAWVEAHMLGWPGLEVASDEHVLLGHITRRLTWRDFRLFASMEPGEQYFEAYRRGLAHLDDFLDRVQAAGGVLAEDTLAWEDAHKAIRQSLDAASDVHARDRIGPADIARVRDAMEGALPSLRALDVEMGRLAKAIDAVGMPLETADEVLELPLVNTWGTAVASMSVALGPLTSPVLNKTAKALASASRRVQRAENREASWLQGLERLDTGGRHRWGARCPTPRPEGLPDARQTARALESLAREISTNQRAVGLTWPADGPFHAIIELAIWQMLEVGWHAMSFHSLKTRFVPPYVPDKFPNKWRKMEPDAPARTLMAHLGKDSYSHIHFDSAQARTITVREAARLQSFPDGFRFEGSMNPAFKQIGNAVPPLFAWRLGEALREALLRADRPDGDDIA